MKVTDSVKKLFSNFMIEVKKLFSGKDGEWSLRRILGGILIIVGIIQLFTSNPPVDANIYAFIYSLWGLVAIALAVLLFGFVTIQNVQSLINKTPVVTSVMEDDGK